VQHLAEVEVAVHPDAGRVDAVGADGAEDLEHRRFAAEHRVPVVARRGIEIGGRAPQQLQAGPDLRTHRLVERALVQGGEGLRDEGLAPARGQGQVELGGAPAEQAHGVEVGADGVGERERWLRSSQSSTADHVETTTVVGHR
jgi:hypothetical protein